MCVRAVRHLVAFSVLTGVHSCVHVGIKGSLAKFLQWQREVSMTHFVDSKYFNAN